MFYVKYIVNSMLSSFSHSLHTHRHFGYDKKVIPKSLVDIPSCLHSCDVYRVCVCVCVRACVRVCVCVCV